MRLAILTFLLLILIPNQSFSKTDPSAPVQEADLDKICRGTNLPMHIFVICQQRAYILTIKMNPDIKLAPNTKYTLGKQTGCDSKASDKTFMDCYSNFVTKHPIILGEDVRNCAKLIDEQKFAECWGWARPPKAATLGTEPGTTAN